MELSVSINQNQLKELLLQVKLVRPVFIWGAPGIGKSAIVEQFAAELGLRLPDRKPACPGGSDRSAADRKRYKRLLPASLSGSKRAVLLVSG